VKRRYYPCVCRNDELICVYDAVVLRSDDSDTGYVARISSFWEDNKGLSLVWCTIMLSEGLF
jgi:hypothetical protein